MTKTPISKEINDLIKNNSVDGVSEFLGRHKNPNILIGEYFRPAIEVAATSSLSKKNEIVSILLDHGADACFHELGTNLTPLSRICMRADSKMAILILEKSKVPVDLMRQDLEGWTAPMFAAASGCDVSLLNAMQSYFETNILPKNPSLKTNSLWSHAAEDGRNAGMVGPENEGVVRWLYEGEGRESKSPMIGLEDRDLLGRTVLWHACQMGDSRAVKRLLGMGAKADTQDNSGLSLLEYSEKMAGSKYGSPTNQFNSAHVYNQITEIGKDVRNAIHYQSAREAIDKMMSEASNNLQPQ